MQGRGKVGWAPLLSPSRSFSEAMAGFHLLGCSVLLSLLSKKLAASWRQRVMRESVMGVSGQCRDRKCHPPQYSHFHISGTGDLGLGLWSTVTFLAFSSCLGCLHLRGWRSADDTRETPDKSGVSWDKGEHRWCVPSLLPFGQPSAQQPVTPIKRWLRLGRGDWSWSFPPLQGSIGQPPLATHVLQGSHL